MRGTVKFTVVGKGFGFIVGEDRQEYFFHLSSLRNANFTEIAKEDKVSFEPVDSKKGLKAENIFVD